MNQIIIPAYSGNDLEKLIQRYNLDKGKKYVVEYGAVCICKNIGSLTFPVPVTINSITGSVTY